MSNSKAILARAKKYEKPMVSFLRDIIAIPSESGQERKVIQRIKREMKTLGAFDRVYTDKMGNLFGRIGCGRKVIAIDAHVDTVGIGDPGEWAHDPYTGKVANGIVYGRGAGDQEGAVPAMVYAGRIIRDLNLPIDDYTLYVVFTVSEEDCDGLCWQYIIKEGGLRPDCVLITDSTNCQVLRGQRGRMEIGVTVTGKSCHGSMPHKGVNAVYRIARVILEIERLNEKLKSDPFLGKGTVAVSYVDCKTPSLCAVPDRAYIHLDRRLTIGETKASALREVRDAVARAGVKAKVQVPRYSEPSYTGLVYETEKYFPTWCEAPDAPQVLAAAEVYRRLFKRKAKVHRWTFSTNGVAIAGMFGIPCVGFGPAPEKVAHTVNDSVPIKHLVQCAAFYAAFPGAFCEMARM
ncbi:MAG: YgeY family selenium metabolism-linked hydrolase [Phycisphaerae bacterium]|nr:YgeY family selenium metabolism-linked hydrolase [Phycisphaerae bacterium]